MKLLLSSSVAQLLLPRGPFLLGKRSVVWSFHARKTYFNGKREHFIVGSGPLVRKKGAPYFGAPYTFQMYVF